MRIKRAFIFLAIILLAQTISYQIASADMNTDLRFKFGGAAGIDNGEITNMLSADASQTSSGNFQIEFAMSPKQEQEAVFVGSIGIFGRNHSGYVSVVSTDIEYDAGGLSGSAGIRFKTSENFCLEAKLEIGLGSGKPTLSTPGFIWNSTKEGAYSSTSLIVGGYYTVGSPGLQIGIEFGSQSFVGEFQIWNNAGYWADGKVEGSGGFTNLVVGYRF